MEIKVPQMGESITEVTIGDWLLKEGDAVEADRPLALIESDKATVELPAEIAGTLAKILKKTGDTARVGEVIAVIDETAVPKGSPPSKEKKASAPGRASVPESPLKGPAARRTPQPPVEFSPAPPERQASAPEPAPPESVVRSSAEPGRSSTPAAPLPKLEGRQKPPINKGPQQDESTGRFNASSDEGVRAPQLATEPSSESDLDANREEETVKMTRLRRTVARRLVEAQHNAALLTTFNEIDMSAITDLRKQLGEAFQKRYQVKLGFMSFFVKACIDALKLVPQVNAEIRGDDIVFKNYYDIAVAIGGGKGLVVPVLRNADRMSFAEVELAIADVAARARDNTLKPEELQGGTFTITNGGIYGSLLSTPIINPPQSGILGMHAIQERPVARAGQVVIRPMMYVALTYDHRLVDGREAVTFLKRIKDVLEDPARMLIEV